MGVFPARGESLARSAIAAAFERLFLFFRLRARDARSRTATTRKGTPNSVASPWSMLSRLPQVVVQKQAKSWGSGRWSVAVVNGRWSRVSGQGAGGRGRKERRGGGRGGVDQYTVLRVQS
jgi:hypothetical protein